VKKLHLPVPCLCNGCYYRNEVCLQLRYSNACRSCYYRNEVCLQVRHSNTCRSCYYRNEVCLQLRRSNACRSCYYRNEVCLQLRYSNACRSGYLCDNTKRNAAAKCIIHRQELAAKCPWANSFFTNSIIVLNKYVYLWNYREIPMTTI